MTRGKPATETPSEAIDARHGPQSEALERLLDRVAWLMDRAVKIPGTRITVGLDALLGLLPVGGDVLTGAVQTGLVLVALYHYRVPKRLVMRMMGNVLLDVAVGSIPLLGDVFDVGFKANTRNVRLLQDYKKAHRGLGPSRSTISLSSQANPRSTGTPLKILVPIALVLISALVLMLIGFVTLIRWMIQ
jgi:hypothetical protein